MSDSLRRKALVRIGEALCSGLDWVVGGPVTVKVMGTMDDDVVRQWPVPVRAVQADVQGGLSGSIVALLLIPAEQCVQATESAVRAVAALAGADVQVAAAIEHTFDSHDDAGEQLDALWSQPMLRLSTQSGDVMFLLPGELVDAIAERMFNPDSGAASQNSSDSPVADAGDDDGWEDAITPSEASDDVSSLASTAAPAHAGSMGDLGADDEMGATSPGATLPGSAAVPASAAGMAGLLGDVQVELSAELGRTHMQLGEAAALQPDSVIVLDRVVEEPVVLYANGSPFAYARLVVVGDEYGVEICELIEQ